MNKSKHKKIIYKHKELDLLDSCPLCSCYLKPTLYGFICLGCMAIYDKYMEWTCNYTTS
jgi:hypothetical protein